MPPHRRSPNCRPPGSCNLPLGRSTFGRSTSGLSSSAATRHESADPPLGLSLGQAGLPLAGLLERPSLLPAHRRRISPVQPLALLDQVARLPRGEIAHGLEPFAGQPIELLLIGRPVRAAPVA